MKTGPIVAKKIEQSSRLPQPKPIFSTGEKEKKRDCTDKVMQKKVEKRLELEDSGAHDKLKKKQQSMTRSLISDNTEDFTNIEEHIDEDTRISVRRIVANTNVHKVSFLRMSSAKSSFKDDTFDSSSCFDEHAAIASVIIPHIN